MWKPMPLIILDDKSTASNALEPLLSVIGEESLVFTTGSWHHDVPGEDELLGFIIDLSLIATEPLKILNAIHKWNHLIPIILSLFFVFRPSTGPSLL